MDHVEGAGPGEPSRILGVSTLAFTVCFAVWTIFAIIGIELKAELGLSDTQFGLLVGTPILTGSLIRVVLGIWTDQYGGRRVFTLVMLAAAAATWALTHAQSYGQLLVAALGVGIAGGSFAVGIAYVSRWYPPSSRARRWACSGPAMSAPPSPSSWRRSSWWRSAGSGLRKSGPRRWW